MHFHPSKTGQKRLPQGKHLSSVLLLAFFTFLISGAANGHQAINTGLLWTNESVTDLAGGIHVGSTYDSELLASIDAYTRPLQWWSGGQVHLSALWINGGEPSSNHIGDFQSVTNIEAPDATRLYSLWYRQQWAKTASLQLGLIDLNTLFDVNQAAGNFLNAAFALDPSLSGNLPVSTYPEPGYGVVLDKQMGAVSIMAGLFQGNPVQRTHPTDNGAMKIAEIDYGQAQNAPTQWGLGFWHDHSNLTGIAGKLNGAYINITHRIETGLFHNARFFLVEGICPGNHSTVPQHTSFGVDLDNPFGHGSDDHLSLGMTRARLRGLKTETTYEITYLFSLPGGLSIQPDIQRVQHPGGQAPDATVFILRLTWGV